MAKPSAKSPKIEQLLEGLTGRTSAIKADRCLDPPIGCGRPAVEFRDEASHREYSISGLCQICQDGVFK